MDGSTIVNMHTAYLLNKDRHDRHTFRLVGRTVRDL